MAVLIVPGAVELIVFVPVTAVALVMSSDGGMLQVRPLGSEAGRAWGQEREKRAVIAVARKLPVLLHRLWVRGDL